MQTVTASNRVMELRKPSTIRRNPLPRSRPPIAAMVEVRAAWQALLGPVALPPSLLEELLLLSNVRKVAAGQQVLSRLDAPNGLVMLVQGDVGLGLLAPPAALRIERSLHGPAWLDLTSAWLTCHPTLDAVALAEAVLVNVSRSAYQTLMEREPELARRTITSLAQQLHAASGVAHDLMHKDAQARLATWLVRRSGAGSSAPQVVLHERKRDIASQLAITPETLSRLLKQFSDHGLLKVHGYTIAILDLSGLQAHAGAGDLGHPA
jgi:Crp-like helix-turn-helix domain